MVSNLLKKQSLHVVVFTRAAELEPKLGIFAGSGA